MKVLSLVTILLLETCSGCGEVLVTKTIKMPLVSVEDIPCHYSNITCKYTMVFKRGVYKWVTTIPTCDAFNKSKVLGREFEFNVSLLDSGYYKVETKEDEKSRSIKDQFLIEACM